MYWSMYQPDISLQSVIEVSVKYPWNVGAQPGISADICIGRYIKLGTILTLVASQLSIGRMLTE